jgi:hypothetical protein
MSNGFSFELLLIILLSVAFLNHLCYINSSSFHVILLFISKLSKPRRTPSTPSQSTPLEPASSVAALPRTPPPPLYHVHTPASSSTAAALLRTPASSSSTAPHRGKIEVMYLGIFYHVCRSIEAMYVGNVDRLILFFKRVVLDQ